VLPVLASACMDTGKIDASSASARAASSSARRSRCTSARRHSYPGASAGSCQARACRQRTPRNTARCVCVWWRGGGVGAKKDGLRLRHGAGCVRDVSGCDWGGPERHRRRRTHHDRCVRIRQFLHSLPLAALRWLGERGWRARREAGRRPPRVPLPHRTRFLGGVKKLHAPAYLSINYDE
jgi:hypothetical protein